MLANCLNVKPSDLFSPELKQFVSLHGKFSPCLRTLNNFSIKLHLIDNKKEIMQNFNPALLVDHSTGTPLFLIWSIRKSMSL